MNMKRFDCLKPWLLAGFLGIFLTACATTQEEVIEDGPPSEDGTATAIVDESMMSAAELLEQSEGALSNRTIYFEFDSAKLTSESIAILETHGSFIAGNGEVTVRLEGHADERGSREYNIALGDRRAQSVRRVLLFQGASTDQIETVSYGEEQPAMSGHTEEAWAKNRRVELIYTVN
jgi:peptidoglycan-associated lipoprotein